MIIFSAHRKSFIFDIILKLIIEIGIIEEQFYFKESVRQTRSTSC